MQIYLAGGMGNLSFEESNEWWQTIEQNISVIAKDLGVTTNIINPNSYFNFLEKSHETEREIRNFDLRLVRSSDLIIVNFNDPQSIGTAQELAVAYELRIPIVGLNRDKYDLHPWLKECCERIFVSSEDMIFYIANYCLQ